jgi:phage tail-like protein
VLGSDRQDRIFVAGRDGGQFGSGDFVVTMDADGNALGDTPLEALDGPATAVTATRNALLIAGARGLLEFQTASVVPEGAEQSRCILVTPVLNAPDRPDQEDGRRWLRIDAAVTLPEGSTLDIAFAATGDRDVHDRLTRLAGDTTVPVSQRVAGIVSEPDIWRAPTQFHGSALSAAGQPDPFSAKLFDTTDPYVWVSVTLTAAVGSTLPRLTELDVRYPGRTLMENLPAIFQREEAQPNSFLRSLVGVLEATTQGMDERIGSMAAHLNPALASDNWLDFLARWLGVPWDDAIDTTVKRRILSDAAVLAKDRGTRAGLEALLECFLPGTPRRYRVADLTADFGFALVGGPVCTGSTLPAMLGGATRWSAELDSRAVLGYMRLPCPNQPDDAFGHLAGRIRIDLAATATERKSWEPWLSDVVADMVPVNTRVALHWVPPQALRSDRLDGTLTLDSAPSPHLGTDAVTGLARLPERGPKLSASGAAIRTRLG